MTTVGPPCGEEAWGETERLTVRTIYVIASKNICPVSQYRNHSVWSGNRTDGVKRSQPLINEKFKKVQSFKHGLHVLRPKRHETSEKF